jgi:RNA polymerase sigma-70 factor (ECF subfamily)
MHRGSDAMTTESRAAPPRVDRDAALLQALRRGDAGAAERLVVRYGDRAYRLAVGITRNAADAEEAVQDALWSVTRRIELFRGDAAFGSWVYRIVANAAYQKLRGRARGRLDVPLDEALPWLHDDGSASGPIQDWSVRVDDGSARTELRVALSAAMDELPPEHRAIVVLRDVEGRSMGEVAESLGISLASAKSRVHRARLFLRERLTAFTSLRGDRRRSA